MPERVPRQIDCPHVIKRHAGKKVVDPQWQPFELLRTDPWHRGLHHPPLLRDEQGDVNSMPLSSCSDERVCPLD